MGEQIDIEKLRAEVEAAAPKIVRVEHIRIHVLNGGRALCGMAGVPKDWAVGHIWVGPIEVSRTRSDPNFCSECLREFDRLVSPLMSLVAKAVKT